MLEKFKEHEIKKPNLILGGLYPEPDVVIQNLHIISDEAEGL